jgi:hypothetical protein
MMVIIEQIVTAKHTSQKFIVILFHVYYYKEMTTKNYTKAGYLSKNVEKKKFIGFFELLIDVTLDFG